jgi:hypothetical protein
VDTIEELSPSGAIVASVPVPRVGSTLRASIDANDTQRFVFTVDVSDACRVEVEYALFAQQQTVSQAGVFRNVSAGTLKLSFSVLGWNFTAADSTLRVRTSLSFAPGVESFSVSEDRSGFAVRTLPVPGQPLALVARVAMAGFGLVDDSVVVPVPFDVSLANGSLSVAVDVPRFRSSFRYDPDFAVTLEPAQDGDSASQPDLLPLLALIAVVMLPAFILLAAAVVATTVVVHRRRRLARTRSGMDASVQVTPADMSSSSRSSSFDAEASSSPSSSADERV